MSRETCDFLMSEQCVVASQSNAVNLHMQRAVHARLL